MARVYAVLRAVPTLARLPYAAAVLWLTLSGIVLITLGLWGLVVAGTSYPALVAILTRDRHALDVVLARGRAAQRYERKEGALWVNRN